MGFSGGDIQHLHAAASALRSVVDNVDGQAAAISQAAFDVGYAAGTKPVTVAATSCLSALVKATSDTGLIVGQLGHVAVVTAENLAAATR
jgi:erythromycin esterase-like protein